MNSLFNIVNRKSLNHSLTTKYAFTLAEVLVTLGIIGVVSALTLPTLVKNHQRQVYVTQLHKVYNQMSQAVELYMTDTRAVSLAETRLRNNSVELKRFFTNYFKVVKDCNGSYVPCFADEYKSLDGSKTINPKHWKCNVVFTLADGTAVCADSKIEDNSKDEDDEDVVNGYNGINVISMEFDINGRQGPNIYGRDYFSFDIDARGNIVDPNKSKHENGIKPSELFGYVGRIIEDGWKMEY